MSEPPELLELVRRWVEKAEHDLTNAAYMLTLEEGCPFDTVCFHAQQCVEKYLKALLTLRLIPFSKTHDLAELRDSVPSNLGLDLSADDLAELSPYAVETRYPGIWESLGRDEAARAVEIAKRVRSAVRTLLPL